MPSAAALDASAITLHRDGSGPPLVLLHCLCVDHHFWDFAAELGRDFSLLRYDLPGHGASAVPRAAYGIAELSTQLADLLAAHGIARAHVAGISLGGLIAQHFAATRPELVDRLILIDTTPRYTDELRAMWDARAATARAAGVAPMIPALLAIWFSADALGRDDVGVRYVRETLARCPGEGYALACEALKAADLRALAPQIARARWWCAATTTFRASSMRRAGSPPRSRRPSSPGSRAPSTPRCWSSPKRRGG